MPDTPYFPLSIPLSAAARARFAADTAAAAAPPLFQLRRLAERLHAAEPAAPAGVGPLLLLARLNAALRFVARRYLELHGCSMAHGRLHLGGAPRRLPALTATLPGFVTLFPPAAVPPAEAVQWLEQAGPEQGQGALAELFLLELQNDNPAAAPLRPLFDDRALRAAGPYPAVLDQLARLLLRRPAGGIFDRPLPELLRAPLRAAPDSLAGQLRYVSAEWGELLPAELLDEILSAIDLVEEEARPRGGGPGPAPILSPDAGLSLDEPERFSPDTDWMPNVVLLAKTIYVWLDQLSRQYGRAIERLDQIPEEEIARLARRGFTALWLIGIWERSPASATIKRRMGNPEAVASAYSLYDYTIAVDLGGEGALQVLRERCSAHGLRLACDVVPNHTGLDSRWTREHPDWYVQVDHPPYPAYRFAGPDLSSDSALQLRIEDGYWEHRDAAVVFQHVQHGRVRYLYHGNDGTHLPWNDTAQLNFLLPEVREAMIRLIVEVARRFPIIRFDAAMTLAKKHFQRLWFPQPGGGAGVPSRAEHALGRDAFEQAFPVEFWREVVDRVAAEVPDTLLLAEAFWLMEGYFVRTLGMHRVYNSAFMNMLKQEDNVKYRAVLKNILEFEPEILKRFVNFMNNPDEDTAAAQFGKGDKYFGVAVMLATLPGLPMFGHGQVEGLEEKYGMEYRRAYRDEAPDPGFIAHHEAQLFPLLHRRRLFSGSEHFALYDFFSGGHVNDDVYAFSNRHGAERALVVYHNRVADTGGWLHGGAARRVRDGHGERLEQPRLHQALALGERDDRYWRCREHKSGGEYLFSARQLAEEGLHLLLGAYDYRVFLDWRELVDDGHWSTLCQELDGTPSPSLDRAWGRLRYAGLHLALRRVLHRPRLAALAVRLVDLAVAEPLAGSAASGLACELERCGRALAVSGLPAPVDAATTVLADLDRLQSLARVRRRGAATRGARWLRQALAAGDGAALGQLVVWRLLAACGPGADDLLSAALLDEVCDALLASPETPQPTPLLALQLRHGARLADAAGRAAALPVLFADPEVRRWLGWHPWDGGHYVNREALQALLHALCLAAAVTMPPALNAAAAAALLGDLVAWCDALHEDAAAAGYRVENFVAIG